MRSPGTFNLYSASWLGKSYDGAATGGSCPKVDQVQFGVHVPGGLKMKEFCEHSVAMPRLHQSASEHRHFLLAPLVPSRANDSSRQSQHQALERVRIWRSSPLERGAMMRIQCRLHRSGNEPWRPGRE